MSYYSPQLHDKGIRYGHTKSRKFDPSNKDLKRRAAKNISVF